MALIDLPDASRRLAYEDAGDRDAWPVFFFHGAPDSRLARHPDTTLDDAAGARLITVDRPGYGGSTRCAGRRVLDWGSDVSALADALGIKRFSVIGWSAGGPHALAVAHHHPERVAAVGLASPLGPLDAPGVLDTVKSDFRLLWRLRRIPLAIKLAARAETNKERKDPSRYIDEVWLKGAPAADVGTVRLEAVRAMAEQEVAEAARQGWAGYFDDLIALTKPWGFSLETVAQPVTLWHGLEDSWLYPEMAKALAARLPNCELNLLPGEGHFLFLRNWSAILADVVKRSA